MNIIRLYLALTWLFLAFAASVNAESDFLNTVLKPANPNHHEVLLQSANRFQNREVRGDRVSFFATRNPISIPPSTASAPTVALTRERQGESKGAKGLNSLTCKGGKKGEGCPEGGITFPTAATSNAPTITRTVKGGKKNKGAVAPSIAPVSPVTSTTPPVRVAPPVREIPQDSRTSLLDAIGGSLAAAAEAMKGPVWTPSMWSPVYPVSPPPGSKEVTIPRNIQSHVSAGTPRPTPITVYRATPEPTSLAPVVLSTTGAPAIPTTAPIVQRISGPSAAPAVTVVAPNSAPASPSSPISPSSPVGSPSSPVGSPVTSAPHIIFHFPDEPGASGHLNETIIGGSASETKSPAAEITKTTAPVIHDSMSTTHTLGDIDTILSGFTGLPQNIETVNTGSGDVFQLTVATHKLLLEFGGPGIIDLTTIQVTMYEKMKQHLHSYFPTEIGPIFSSFDLIMDFSTEPPTGFTLSPHVNASGYMQIEAVIDLETNSSDMLVGFNEDFATRIFRTFFDGPNFQAFLDDLDNSGMNLEFLRLVDDANEDSLVTHGITNFEESTVTFTSSSSKIAATLGIAMIFAVGAATWVRRFRRKHDDASVSSSQNLKAWKELEEIFDDQAKFERASPLTGVSVYQRNKPAMPSWYEKDEDSNRNSLSFRPHRQEYEDDESIESGADSFLNWPTSSSQGGKRNAERVKVNGKEKLMYRVDL